MQSNRDHPFSASVTVSGTTITRVAGASLTVAAGEAVVLNGSVELRSASTGSISTDIGPCTDASGTLSFPQTSPPNQTDWAVTYVSRTFSGFETGMFVPITFIFRATTSGTFTYGICVRNYNTQVPVSARQQHVTVLRINPQPPPPPVIIPQ